MLVFYKEWFPLAKSEFRLLVMLADLGSFEGNLSDICRYFSLNPQTKTRNAIKASLQRLETLGFIKCEMSGRNYKIVSLPQAQTILLPRKYFEALVQNKYTTEEVSKEAVLKVFLWISQNQEEIVTNGEISEDLNLSPSTIGSAKNVLEKQFGAIYRRKITEKVETPQGTEVFLTRGQELKSSAWWSEI